MCFKLAIFCLYISFYGVNTESKTKCNVFTKLFRSKGACIDAKSSYNPDEYLNVPQIIARHGYNSESHIVTTKDGYLLELHRILGSRGGKPGKQPVFLQHGLLGNSADWLINGNNSLGFLLADKGYDVWLGNARGNTYSKGHIHLSVKNSQYWNFSFHEMGTKDLPAALNYVGSITRKPGEILYIGYSMGTTMFFVFSSLMPKAAKIVKAMVALAPVAYMTHIKSPITYFAPYSYSIQVLADYFETDEFLPNNRLMNILEYKCGLLNINKVCNNTFLTIYGFNKQEFNTEILPVVLAKDPAGTSTKTVIHYAQEFHNKGNFQRFDYGSEGNMIQYGTETPPPYNLSKITRPVNLIYARNDLLTDYTDVQRLSSELKNLRGKFEIQSDTFGHLEFIFGKHAETYIYQPVIKILGNYTMQ